MTIARRNILFSSNAKQVKTQFNDLKDKISHFNDSAQYTLNKCINTKLIEHRHLFKIQIRGRIIKKQHNFTFE